MSRKAECYDNAMAESLRSTIKREIQIPKSGYENLEEIRSVLFEYIDAYHNPKSLYSSIGYKSPNKFEMLFYQTAS